ANSVVEFTFKLVIAALVFYAGRYIIKKLYEVTSRVMVNRKVDKSLTTFVLSLVKILLYFILIITVIGILGIETSSFLALFASAGVAIGMALSGTLQNFAGGVLILLLKPYRVGDYIEAQGYAGTVKEIQIFHTVINTADNKAIIIPNGGLSTGSINNYSLEDYRRVDWTVSLAYGDDYEKAREVILEMLAEEEAIVKTTIAADRQRRALKIAEDKREAIIEECARHPEDKACRELLEETENPAPEKKRSWMEKMFGRKDGVVETEGQVFKQITVPSSSDNIERPPFVGLNALADSSINLTVRAWTHSADYWTVFFKMNQRFYKELPERGFNFPFPQMDVHISQSTD
ncbi:MAG: mechanosensitive ion channel, partial [Muribaculaceae bacterium]|nr:mechanosensitive ion channel [Muribaculaceae bacterium]